MSTDQIAAAAIGGALLTAGVARQTLVRRSIGRALREALRDPEPQVRAAAVQTAGENGIGRNARLLLAVASTEQDIWVRQVIAQTVHRHLWEPPTARALVDLRIWARKELIWGQLETPALPVEATSAAATGQAAQSATTTPTTTVNSLLTSKPANTTPMSGVIVSNSVINSALMNSNSTTASGEGAATGGFLRERPRIAVAGRGWDVA